MLIEITLPEQNFDLADLPEDLDYSILNSNIRTSQERAMLAPPPDITVSHGPMQIVSCRRNHRGAPVNGTPITPRICGP